MQVDGPTLCASHCPTHAPRPAFEEFKSRTRSVLGLHMNAHYVCALKGGTKQVWWCCIWSWCHSEQNSFQSGSCVWPNAEAVMHSSYTKLARCFAPETCVLQVCRGRRQLLSFLLSNSMCHSADLTLVVLSFLSQAPMTFSSSTYMRTGAASVNS